MSDVVLRWEVPVDDEWHEVECFGPVVAVNSTNPSVVEFWTHERSPLETLGLRRAFRIYGTGHPTEPGARCAGTAIVPPQFGRLVWHLFERPSR